MNEVPISLDLHTGEESRRPSKSVAFDLTPSVHTSLQSSPQLSPRSLPTSAEQSPTFDGAHNRQEQEEHDQHSYDQGRRMRRGNLTERTPDTSDESIRSEASNEPAQRRRERIVPRLQESDDSGTTITLPDRFDEQGRRMPERGDEPHAGKVHDMPNGRESAGRFFHTFASDLYRSRSSSGRGR